MHPSEAIFCARSEKLKGKRIVVGVTGSIAAVETVKLIRELIRHGADVFPLMSPEAKNIVHPNVLEFASGKKPVIDVGGDVPYIQLLEGKKKADLYIIAPCTSNTLSKIAWGVSDTIVTLFATQGFGLKIPLILVPSMHIPMYENPIMKSNIRTLKKLGVEFIDPKVEESAAKLPGIEEMVAKVIRKVGQDAGALKGKKVIVIGGSNKEPIDDVRFVSAYSTGATAVELARNAFEMGADVQLLMGRCEVQMPGHIPTKRFETVGDLLKLVPKLKCDICLVPAALSDYTPVKTRGKISSRYKGLILELKAQPKVIELIRRNRKCFLVGFKAEYRISVSELEKRASERLQSARLDMIVANDIAKIEPEKNEIIIIRKKGKKETFKGTRAQLADRIMAAVADGAR